MKGVYVERGMKWERKELGETKTDRYIVSEMQCQTWNGGALRSPIPDSCIVWIYSHVFVYILYSESLYNVEWNNVCFKASSFNVTPGKSWRLSRAKRCTQMINHGWLISISLFVLIDTWLYFYLWISCISCR